MKENIKLGQLLGSAEQRDAVHVAVLPCQTEYDTLLPGTHVGILRQDEYCVWVAPMFRLELEVKPIGIVDPFLTHPVGPKHRFYVLLYPNTVTGMRHHWKHPAIDGKERG